MTDPNHIELLREIRRVYGGTEAIAALDAAITALSARASAGEGGSPEVVVRRDERGAIVAVEVNGRVIASNAEWLAAAPQPAQAGASGGGEWEIAEIMRGCLSAIEGGRDPRYGFSIGPSIEGIEEAAKRIAAMLATPASPATERQADEQYRGEEWQCCGNEKSGSCCGKYERVWHEDDDATPQPAAAQGGMTFAFMAEVCDAAVQAMQANGLIKRTIRLQEVRDQLRQIAAAPQPQEAPAQQHGHEDSRPCYMCGQRADAHPMVPGPRGGTKRGECPATPPAHGDGEEAKDFAKCPCGTDDIMSVEIQRCDAPRQLRGDLYLAYCKWCGRGVPFVSARYHEAIMPEAMAAWNAALTTRPTPEAQEARDAARYRWLRLPGNATVYARDAANFNEVPHHPGGHFRYVEPANLDAAIDAALALPAQGEGS